MYYASVEGSGPWTYPGGADAYIEVSVTSGVSPYYGAYAAGVVEMSVDTVAAWAVGAAVPTVAVSE